MSWSSRRDRRNYRLRIRVFVACNVRTQKLTTMIETLGKCSACHYLTMVLLSALSSASQMHGSRVCSLCISKIPLCGLARVDALLTEIVIFGCPRLLFMRPARSLAQAVLESRGSASKAFRQCGSGELSQLSQPFLGFLDVQQTVQKFAARPSTAFLLKEGLWSTFGVHHFIHRRTCPPPMQLPMCG
jgi:hypothetical protein